jgi:hypothetical protein
LRPRGYDDRPVVAAFGDVVLLRTTGAARAGTVSIMPLIHDPAQRSPGFTDAAFASELTALLRQAR